MELNKILSRESFPEIIANKLEEMIINGKFVSEQKLPSEQTLADEFGVSRPVIRESMKILKERGLVIQKNGGGTFICEPDSDLVTETLNRIVHLKNIDIDDIFSLRITLETMAIELAAARADDEELNELQAINDHMRKSKEDVGERAKADVLFHRKIAQMSGNMLLEVFVEAMASLVTPVVKYTLDRHVGNEEGIEFHDRIIKVLRTHNAGEAAKQIQRHLELSKQNYILAQKDMSK